MYWALAGLVGLVALLAGSATAAPNATTAAARRILLVGDSLTAAPGGYGPLLQAQLGRHATVELLAIGGRGVRVLGQKLPAVLVRFRPTDVVVLLGVNDLASKFGARFVCDGLAGIWRASRAAGARVYAVQILPWGAHRLYDGAGTAAVNRWIDQARGFPGGPDVEIRTSGLGDATGRVRSEYGGPLHLNRAGYRELTRLVAAALAGTAAAVGAGGTTDDRDTAETAAWRLHRYLQAAGVRGTGSVEELAAGHGELRLRATLYGPTADDLAVVRRVPQVDGLDVHVVIAEAA